MKRSVEINSRSFSSALAEFSIRVGLSGRQTAGLSVRAAKLGPLPLPPPSTGASHSLLVLVLSTHLLPGK
jgi:hypothetical protein